MERISDTRKRRTLFICTSCILVAFSCVQVTRFIAQFGCTRHNFCDISLHIWVLWLVACQWIACTLYGVVYTVHCTLYVYSEQSRRLHCSNKSKIQTQFSRGKKNNVWNRRRCHKNLLTNHFSLFIGRTRTHWTQEQIKQRRQTYSKQWREITTREPRKNKIKMVR